MHPTSQRALPGAAPAAPARPGPVVPGAAMQGHIGSLPRNRFRIVAA